MPRRRGRTVVRLNRVPFVEERMRVRAYRAGGVVVGRVIQSCLVYVSLHVLASS